MSETFQPQEGSSNEEFVFPDVSQQTDKTSSDRAELRSEFEITSSQDRLLRDAREILSSEVDEISSSDLLEKVINTEAFLKNSYLILLGEDPDFGLPKSVPTSSETLDEIPNIWRDNFLNSVKGNIRTMDNDAARNAYLEAVNRRLKYFNDCKQICVEFGLTISDLESKIEEYRKLQKQYIENHVEVTIPKSLISFSPGLRDVIVGYTSGVELNRGCSVRCAFCAFGADKKVTNAMPFSEASWLAIHIQNDSVFFYEATDTLDYKSPDGKSDYADFLTIYEAAHGFLPYSSSGYPEGAKKTLDRVGDRLTNLSISYMNRERLKKDGVIDNLEGDPVFLDPSFADGVFFGGAKGNSPRYETLSKKEYYGVPISMEPAYKGHFDKVFFRPWTDRGYKNFAAPDSNKLKLSGRQRKTNAKLDNPASIPEYTTSIQCVSGVEIKPDQVFNMVPSLSSSENEKGYIETEILPENIGKGAETVLSIRDGLKQGKKYSIKDVMQYGVVRNSFGGGYASQISSPEYLKKFEKRKKIDGKWVIKPFEYSDIIHTVGFNTYNDQGDLLAEWKCTYHQVDGSLVYLESLSEYRERIEKDR